MSRILVIGAGFTGPYVIEELRSNPAHSVFSSKEYGIDITQKATILAALEKTTPDIVINLAAIATLKVEDVRRIYEVNGFGVLNILEALRETGFKGRFITASSAQVYGNHTPGIIEETQLPQPVNHYSCAKLLAENICAMYSGYFSTTAARVFNCIGRGHHGYFVVPKLVRHFKERAPMIELGNSKVERDYIDIRDIARMYRLVAEAETPPPLLHFCNQRVHTIDDIISVLTGLTGHRIDVQTNPAFLRASDNLHMCGSNATLAGLGYRPRHSLEDTLKWMLEE